ncbi:hypothetical protein FA13DRAFT_1523568 [Coprinellus micaceus]|uniref:Fungal-type protein kinase domain-containing protein n=1 Tax=Coprinellus micaceus TaxID=71717 RepID=A0A4Y7SJT5_COPMI|nr:hypothetical protein FA13DRAFT_1523568 [Coprinellus micaceus]
MQESSSNHNPKFTTTSEGYPHEIYRDVLEEAVIEDFLRDSDAFDHKEKMWAFPQPLAATESVVVAVCRIARSIIKRFVVPTRSGVRRTVVNMIKAGGNEAVGEYGYRPCPVVVIQASGPSFEDPPPTSQEAATTSQQRQISFSNMASYFTVKLDSEVGTPRDILEEMKPYAKKIFADQPNRLYVRSLLLTEKHARLLHFDRAGAQITPSIDIQQHPSTFVRLIAGVASMDERLLGLDDSIQWTIIEGRKTAGVLTTTGANGKAKAYPILAHIPNPLESIRGRGTTCWRVRDPDTLEELVVKDSWRPQDRPAEQEFLKLATGVPGVAQMVSFQNGRGETKHYRCPTTAGQYHNRVAMRVTMKSYGRSVEFFSSVVELLEAIRDAIAGHQRLVSSEGIKVLHRDISHNNILLGPAGAREGNRGILIDFDMSFRATDEKPRVDADANVGTRTFQSLSVVGSFSPRDIPTPHDYLDDLESFFLVLVYILLTRRADGTTLPSRAEGPSIVGKWDNPDPNIAYGKKDGILGGSADDIDAVRIIKANWGPAFVSLYKRFQAWVCDVSRKKAGSD